MTPAEHLAEAERLLAEVQSPEWADSVIPRSVAATTALAHAVIAVGGELGVPHGGVKGGQDATQAPA